MNLPMEFLLMAGVVGFYLQDSMSWLHYDEMVLVQRRRGWRASVGADATVGGRHPFLPNPLMPARAVFRVGWLSDAPPAVPGHWPALRHFVDALAGFRPGCRLVWLLLLAALPILLFVYPHPLALLALLVMVYATVAGLVFRLWRYRRVLGLETRAVMAMGFELLCCPPYAINLVGRLSLRRGLGTDAITATVHLAGAAELIRIREPIRRRIEVALAFREEMMSGTVAGSTIGTRLIRARERLEQLG